MSASSSSALAGGCGLEQPHCQGFPATLCLYSYACPSHGPIYARCTSEDGMWTRTEIIPPDAEPG